MLMCSDVSKKAITEFICLVLFIDLNESYILQVYFAETSREILGIPIFHFCFFKDSNYFISTGKISQILEPI